MRIPKTVSTALTICLSSFAYSADIFKIDFQNNLGDEQGGDWITHILAADDPSFTVSVDTIDVTLTAINGIFQARGGSGDGRSTAITGTSYDDMIEDLVAARNGDGSISIEITGLSSGENYRLVVWHNDSNNGNAGFSEDLGYEVVPSVTSGATSSVIINGASNNEINGNHSDSDFTPTQITFEATANTVVIQLAGASTNNFLSLSGITLEDNVGVDTDGDGIPDNYEDITPGLDSNDITDAMDDEDGDEVNNLIEFQDGTDPNLADTDGDGLDDGDEKTAGSDPLVTDTDGDFFLDGDDTNPTDSSIFPINPNGLFVDFSGTAENGQAGTFHSPAYQPFIAVHETDANTADADAALLVERSKSFSVPAFSNANVTLDVSFPSFSGTDPVAQEVKQMISRPAVFSDNYVGEDVELIRDWIGIDPRASSNGGGPDTPTTMKFTLTGIPAGVYQYRAYHHDVENLEGAFEIQLTDANLTQDSLGLFRMSHSSPSVPLANTANTPETNPGDMISPSTLYSTIEFLFTSNGTDPVEIEYFATEKVTSGGNTDFRNSFVAVNGFEITAATDTDGDRIPDDSDPTPAVADSSAGAADDGLTNLREYHLGTSLQLADTDSDGLNDGVETFTDIFVDATDTGTSPFSDDFDGDSFNDGDEIAAGSDPFDDSNTPDTLNEQIIASISVTNGTATITWQADENATYSVYANENLSGNIQQDWILVDDNVSGATPSFSESLGGAPVQFYAVVRE